MKLFNYSEKDLEDQNLDFDSIVTSEWTKVNNVEGVFKYKLDSSLKTRILPGKYSFIVQYNPNRFSQKRVSEIKQDNRTINLNFDEAKFNFSKINTNEILFKINCQDDYLIINNSPIEFSHCLIVPSLNSKLNQILNKDSIRIGVQLLALSKSNNLIIGFNSIRAYASVNHLHLHFYYLNSIKNENKYLYPIQNVNKAEKLLENGLVWFISDYQVPGFSLQLFNYSNNIDIFIDKIYLITNYLAKNEIAHNLVFIKADCFENNHKQTIRCVIWPKKKDFEIESNDKNICFAMSELSGHFLLPDLNDYQYLNEDYLLNIAQKVALDSDQIFNLKNEIKNLF